MTQDQVLKLAVFLFFVCFVISCGTPAANTSPPPQNTRVFSPQEVCSYPARVSAKIFHKLGSGVWDPVAENDARAGYNCSGAISSVQIFVSPEGSINVEYLATGTERGATTVTMTYTTANATDNEPTYRTVFLNFANDTLRQALQEPMSDLMRKKIQNLTSYFKPGTDNEETFYIRDGFVLLTREHDQQNSSITVKLKIFSDKALKLDQTR
ncbi:MAG: hypothetical protein WBD27_00920 [Pyrinomonadaceae bacterium]